MRVLLVSVKSEIQKGGIAVWTEQYLRGCKQNGIEVSLVNTEAIGKIAINSTGRRNFKDEFLRCYKISKQLNEQLKKNRYDIVHFNTSIGFFGIIRDYYLIKRIVKSGLPVILHFHCDIPFWITNSVVKYYLKKTLKLTSKNVVLCNNSRQYLKNEFKVESDIIPNFLEQRLVIHKKSIRQNIRQVCFVGRVSIEKGAKELFEVADMFSEIEFKFAGEVTKEVSEWKKPQNIELLGAISHDKIINLLDESDVFLFLSHSEGFSLALLESMARGLPSIVTDVGANRDMLNGCGGRVIQVGDIEATKKAIEEMQDSALRYNMSLWNIEKVCNNYTIEKVVQELNEKYGRIVEENKCQYM